MRTSPSDIRSLVCKALTDPNRGFALPESLGFPANAETDAFGRPRIVNLSTVTDYYNRDILAVDRLMLPETNRTKPLFPFQRLIFEAIGDPDKQFIFLQMMRGGSKTYSCARGALDLAQQVPNLPIIFTGPSFRQSLLMFDAVTAIIDENARNEHVDVKVSNEIVGEIKRNQTECIVRFRNGSAIRALPMGDGSKIRGIRGGVLFLDEFYQMTEEQYESHIKPFAQVKQGNRPSKIIHLTTSWYQDCFAYKRLMQIASEVKAGNKHYAILDFNLKDIADSGFPLDKMIWRDAVKHGNPVTTAMTYFNLWPSSSARWFEQKYIDYAISAQHGVRIEMKRAEKMARYYMVVDLAASDHGDSTEVIVFRWDDETDKAKAVWAHKEQGLKPNERAWLVHETREKFNPEFIIYDANAAIGIDLRSLLAEKELLVRGTLRKVRPLVHWDAYNITNADRMLIPVSSQDKVVAQALLGPRDGSEIAGHSGLRELLFTKARDLLVDGSIVGPGSAKEADENGESVNYSGSEIEVLDIIREAFLQLGYLGPKRDKQGNIMYGDGGRLLFTTRGGQHDDGAMCIIYSVIGYFRMLGRKQKPQSTRPITKPMTQETQRSESSTQIGSPSGGYGRHQQIRIA